MKLRPFTEDLITAVVEFNNRLRAGGADPDLLFPENPASDRFPDAAHGISERMFLIAEDDPTGPVHGGFILPVHGAFILKDQDFWVGEQVTQVTHYRLPVSEGIVNRRYASVGMQMTRYALADRPLLFALGMGGRTRPLPKLLESLKWCLWEVPFYFSIEHPTAVLKNLGTLRSNAPRRIAMDLAAFTGFGWIGISAWSLFARARAPASGTGSPTELTVEQVPSFSDWADEIWDNAKQQYSFAAVRNSATLNLLYPASNTRFLRCRASSAGTPRGWFVALDTAMQNHKQFGNLRVGTIVDAFARPQDAAAVIQAASRFLRARGVDLLISNQMHPAWCAALRSAGFLQGPSNFVLAVSPGLQQHCGDGNGIHINRGDGDGPIHL